MPIAPYGTWDSPITADLLVSGSTRVDEIATDVDRSLYWGEARPAERGRTAIMGRAPDGTVREITPPEVNVRTAVHEYGGGAWSVERGLLVFSSFPDHRLWLLSVDAGGALAAPRPLTDATGDRFADGRLTADGQWYVCVREQHHANGQTDNDLVAVATDGSHNIVVLTSGADFYSSPRLAPGGAQLAWLEWHHPDMPWDHTELWVAQIELAGTQRPLLRAPRRIAGSVTESIVQPEWSADAALHWCSDRSGWWNLYRDGAAFVVGAFEIALPQWVFGQRRFAILTDGSIAYVEGHPDGDRLVVGGRPIALPLTMITQVVVLGDTVVVLGGSHTAPTALWCVDRHGAPTLLHAPAVPAIDSAFLPEPEHITFPTEGGDHGAEAHALFYRPASATHSGPNDEKPPLIVVAHGGPTSAARPQLSFGLRYWTSRGFAVVDVNYRGSTGYGKPYRRALDRAWGVDDVADCVAAARYLSDRGDVDGQRLAIRGASAGGFTVLCALAFHPGVFAAGASHYGIADLEALAVDTHKFESRYLDQLVAPYPAERQVYLDRSPIYHVDRLSTPLIVFQGLDDKVVPPNQADMIVSALRGRGVTCEYVTFAGEGHGLRQAANLTAAIEAEAAFYRRVFGLDAAGG